MRRAIASVSTRYEQQIPVHTLRLECGHTVVYRNDHPKRHVDCKQCDQAQPTECDCPGCLHDVGCVK